jgi:hypothetical protein
MQPLPIPLLALDPSSTHQGWALLSYGHSGPILLNSGVYRVPEAPPDERVLLVGDGIQCIVNECYKTLGPASRIAMALIEVPDYIADYAIAENIVRYFRGVGVAEYAIYRMGIPIQYEHASKLKRQSRKLEGKKRFHMFTGRHPITDDESDAFCMGCDYLASIYKAAGPVQASIDDEFEEYEDGELTGRSV